MAAVLHAAGRDRAAAATASLPIPATSFSNACARRLLSPHDEAF